MALLALGFTSCKQEEDPKYKAPTKFTVNAPALADQELQTNGDMTNSATFNLFCSQPDYGYSAICNYSALCSLNPDAPEEEWIALPNETPTQAAMTIKLFELGVAVNKLLNVVDQEHFDQNNFGDTTYKVFFKGVCEIPSIEGSRIVSDNIVSYNFVKLVYAEKKPAWIYILGDVSNPETGVSNGFTGPAAGNAAWYDANFRLYEPEDMIGEKIYTGVYVVDPKEHNPDKSYEDQCSQFRFAYALLGWTSGEGFLGSNKADFYCLPISDKYEAGYTGKVVFDGLGNWGIWTETPVTVTIVVDQVDLNIYVVEGARKVTFTGRNPSFD